MPTIASPHSPTTRTTSTQRDVPTDTTSRAASLAPYAWAVARIAVGWLFLWAFVDKTFGLGRSTASADAWIDGGNPTKGYLSSATGPFDGLYHSIAGDPVVNVLFMAGLLAVGLTLMLGIGSRLGTVGGVLMLVLMWSSHLPVATNPFVDEHLIYSVVLVGLLLARADRTLGLGERWSRVPAVQRRPWLR